MSAGSYAPPLAADAPHGLRSSRVEAVRRVLASCLTADRSRCAEAVDVLGVEWLRQQGLAPLVWQACHDDLPVAMQTELRAAYYAAAGDAELHHHELLIVLQTLAAHNLIPVVFKGAALAYTVYPDPACRPMGDLDLWVDGDVMPKACHALETIGYRVKINPDRPPALKRMHGEEIQLCGSTSATGLVELHGGVFVGEWLRLAAHVDEAAVRARAAAATLLEQPVLLLAPEDAILQILIHAVINHQLGMAALRSITDAALLARTFPIDWPELVARAHEWRLTTAVWLPLSLAVELDGLDEAAPAVSQLAPGRARQWLIARFVNNETVLDERDLRRDGLRFVFLLLLVDRKHDALKLIYRALWPEREWLRARYGQVSVKVRVRHVINAARGRI